MTKRDQFCIDYLTRYQLASSYDTEFIAGWQERFGGGWLAGSNLERNLLKMFKAGLLTRKRLGVYKYSLPTK